MDTSLFRTRQLQVAAFLMARGMEFAHSEREDRTVYFYFRDKPACLALQDEFLAGSPPEKRFWTAFNNVRDMVFSG